jgi:hypothetical protein
LKLLSSPFLWWVFSNRVSRTICLGWFQIAILLISASWVARITRVSHQHLASSSSSSFSSCCFFFFWSGVGDWIRGHAHAKHIALPLSWTSGSQFWPFLK